MSRGAEARTGGEGVGQRREQSGGGARLEERRSDKRLLGGREPETGQRPQGRETSELGGLRASI